MQKLSWLKSEFKNLEEWQNLAKEKVFELMAFEPPNANLDAKIHYKEEDGDICREVVSYNPGFGPPIEAIYLYPKNKKNEKFPAIIALHDHGGFKYFGKEKITKSKYDYHPFIKQHKTTYYSGRDWPTELAKLGFAVLVPDVFLFGSRGINVNSMPKNYQEQFDNIEFESSQYIEKYNQISGEYESLVAKTLFVAGTTWPAIFSYDDRISLDYLCSRNEVDTENIGCCGLSGGGLRTVFLAGLDSRIKCGVCVGFMFTFKSLIQDKIKMHTWMIYVPHLTRYLDLPDLIGLRVPKPLMVQYDTEDELFTIEGQKDADEKLKLIYKKSDSEENYSGKFYPGPHKFDIEMQEDAFEWLNKWLRI